MGLALQDGLFGIVEIQYPISINVQTLPSTVSIEEITETEEKQQMPVQTTPVGLEEMD